MCILIKVVKSISDMHGDLEGITGPSLPVIKMLELNSQESIKKILEVIS